MTPNVCSDYHKLCYPFQSGVIPIMLLLIETFCCEVTLTGQILDTSHQHRICDKIINF